MSSVSVTGNAGLQVNVPDYDYQGKSQAFMNIARELLHEAQKKQRQTERQASKIPEYLRAVPKDVHITVDAPNYDVNKWIKSAPYVDIKGGTLVFNKPTLWGDYLRGAKGTGTGIVDKALQTAGNANKEWNNTLRRFADAARNIGDKMPRMSAEQAADLAKEVAGSSIQKTREEVQALGDHFLDKLVDKGAHGLKVGAGAVASGAAGNIFSHILFGEEGPHAALTVLAAIAGGIGTNKLLKKYPNVV